MYKFPHSTVTSSLYGPNTMNNTLFSYVVSLRKLLLSVTCCIHNTTGKMLPIYVKTKQLVYTQHFITDM